MGWRNGPADSKRMQGPTPHGNQPCQHPFSHAAAKHASTVILHESCLQLGCVLMAEVKASQPAAAAYADAATPWLPVLTAATRRNPKARPIDTDTLMLRSFHDQVGLAVSFLRE